MMHTKQAAFALSNPASINETGFDDPLAAVLADEPVWRVPPHLAHAKAFATRWRAAHPQPCELHHQTPSDRHVVMVVMNTANIRFSVDGVTVHDGVAMPGMFHVAEPGVKVSCLFRGPYDVVH